MLNQKQKDKIDSMFESGGLTSFWKSLRVSAVKANTEPKRKLLVDLLDYAIDKAYLNENKSTFGSISSSNKKDHESNKTTPSVQENDEEEPMRLFTYMNSQKSNS
jgi:hypothetical protein